MSAPALSARRAAAGPPIVVEDLRVHFPTRFRRETVKAVDGISFIVGDRETFGIIGESGSGKSTLGRVLVCLTSPTEGRVLLGGADPSGMTARQLRRYRSDYQMIFQDPNAALDPRMTLLESVREPLEIAGDGSKNDWDRTATATMERVGLSFEMASRYPHQVSGGQKQRANIARAIIRRPTVLICDEVVAALDVSIQAEVLNLFAELQRDFGLTYVFISHDLAVVSHVSDRIAVMYLGVFVEMGPAEAVRSRPKHPYTEALLSAEPQPFPSSLRGADRIILEGEIPSPIAPPKGCRFHTRCRYAESRCAAEVPEWTEIESGHWAACHFAGSLSLGKRGAQR